MLLSQVGLKKGHARPVRTGSYKRCLPEIDLHEMSRADVILSKLRRLVASAPRG